MRTASGTRSKSSALALEVRVPHEGRAFAALAGQLSLEGVFVSTFHGVRAGSAVLVELSLGGEALLLHGVAGPPSASSTGFAVMFDDLTPAERARILLATGGAAHASA